MPATSLPAATVVLLHPDDNVCVATRNLEGGSEVTAGGRTVRLTGAVRLGHKIALVPIAKGGRVYRYGQTIGFATEAIEPGDWVHTHNVEAGAFSRDYEYATEVPPDPAPIEDHTFQGYRRADGRAGTRNYIAIISNVNCSASVSKYVAQRFDHGLLKDFPNVDGILPLTHKGGCGMQYGGEDHQQLARTMAGFAKHPNVGGYLLIGLGCETASLPYLVETTGLVQIAGVGSNGVGRKLPPVLTLQECGGTAKTIEAAHREIMKMLPDVDDVRRETIPASEIVLGLNCGGSDGNSGITANPALGVASDLLVAAGGTAVLAETSEVYGAEHLLTRRARTRAIGEKLAERIRWWERYAEMFGAELNNNPSQGNKEGGLTTIYEKSLGAVTKAGSTALAGVYLYGEQVTGKGFVFMDTPGFDPVSVTGLVAGGCNVIAFTTGRGSCFGCKPSPSIKIATNTPMYERMIGDMDIDAGMILDGTPVEQVGRRIFEYVLEVASGSKTKSELLGVGEEEFAPWSIGPTL
ncbi:MAG TPA: altronate dehydratase family protein [Pirellulales bacterium]|nr:altronate dehydratase family protein [Pirellulales bacterium]